MIKGKLLREKVGKHLKFETRMENLCSKVGRKLYSLAGVLPEQNDNEIVHYVPFLLMFNNIDEP